MAEPMEETNEADEAAQAAEIKRRIQKLTPAQLKEVEKAMQDGMTLLEALDEVAPVATKSAK